MTDEQIATLTKVIDDLRARKEDNEANILQQILDAGTANRGGGNGAGTGPHK